MHLIACCNSAYRLRYWNRANYPGGEADRKGCNSAYRLRYWNIHPLHGRVHLRRRSCNSAYRLRYWNGNDAESLQYLPKNRVATALTACGIETVPSRTADELFKRLQQRLPLAVLKHNIKKIPNTNIVSCCNSAYRLRYWNNSRSRIFYIFHN